jgi:hypothetical protein
MKHLSLLTVMLALTGCGVKAPIQARMDPYIPSQVQLTSEDLRTRVAFDAPRVNRDPAGLLFVTVPIRAATNKQLYVDYRAIFIGDNGLVLERGNWTPITLSPNVFDNIQFNSLTPNVRDFQFQLRWSQ